MPDSNATEFHIHVDAIEMDASFERDLLTRRGFQRVAYSIDRSAVDLESGSAEHEFHLTYKTRSVKLFNAATHALFDTIKADAPIHRGYVECECVTFKRRLDFQPFRAVPVPLRLQMRPPPPGAFRESEIHVTLSLDESDPRLLRALHDEIGMLSGFIPKTWGMAEILTVQGTRSQIDEIRDALWNYLRAAGGAARCCIKEERTTRHWISHPTGIGLPYVIDKMVLFAGRAVLNKGDAVHVD